MKIIVLGGTGLLGEAVMRACQGLGHEAVAASRASKAMPLDITDRRHIADAVAAYKPEVMINCAAIASIDACESQPGKAFEVNAAPVAELAQLSRRGGFKLVHISTDHFFTGDGDARHGEDAPVTLVNEYAKSKYAAEASAALAPGALTVRTAFVGRTSARAGGFAEQVHAALRKGEELTLFEDAYTSLLHVSAVADAMLRLIACKAAGIINVASRDVFTKADLIRAFARKLNMPLKAKSGSVKSLAIPRAESLGLAVGKAEGLLGGAMPGFDDTVGLLAADFAH